MIKLIFRQFEISISHITGECASKHYVGVGSCIKGGGGRGQCCTGKKPKV